MAISIVNDDLRLIYTEDSVTTYILKDNARCIAFGDIVRITDYLGTRYEFLYSDVVAPAEASAVDLKAEIDYYLQVIVGGGGGGSGTVTSVSATIDEDEALDVTVTNPTTTPAIALTWEGTAADYVTGNGFLGNFADKVAEVSKELYESNVFFNGSTAGYNGMIYVDDYDLLYAVVTNNVLVFDTTTGARVATLAIASAQTVFYIQDVNDGAGGTRDEVWVGVASSTTITRLSTANPPTSLGTFTNTGGSGAFDYVDFNGTYVYLANANGASLTKVNKTSNPPAVVGGATTITGLTSILYIALNDNPASNHYNHIIISQAATGISLFDTGTDTIIIAATTLGGVIGNARQAGYSTVMDRWVLSDYTNNRILYIDPDSATTWAADGYTYNLSNVSQLYCDNVSDKIFASLLPIGTVVNANLAIASISPATKQIEKVLVLSGHALDRAYFISKINPPNELWCGCRLTFSSHKVIYY